MTWDACSVNLCVCVCRLGATWLYYNQACQGNAVLSWWTPFINDSLITLKENSHYTTQLTEVEWWLSLTLAVRGINSVLCCFCCFLLLNRSLSHWTWSQGAEQIEWPFDPHRSCVITHPALVRYHATQVFHSVVKEALLRESVGVISPQCRDQCLQTSFCGVMYSVDQFFQTFRNIVSPLQYFVLHPSLNTPNQFVVIMHLH